MGNLAAETRVSKPPSIPVSLWDAVPEDLRESFVKAAAEGLRRGHHPEYTFTTLLREHGVDVPARSPSDGIRARPHIPTPPTAMRMPRPVPQQRGGPAKPASVADQVSIEDVLKRVVDNDPMMAFGDALMIAKRLAGSDEGKIDALVKRIEDMAEARMEYLRSLPEAERGGWIDPDDWSFNSQDMDNDAPDLPRP